MTTRSILERAVLFMGQSVDLTTETQTAEAMRSCLDHVLVELSGQFKELLATAVVTTDSGRIPYAALSDVVRILCVKKDDRKVRFVSYPSYVDVKECGTYAVVYQYRLHAPGLNDAIILPPEYDEDVLAAGVAAEYLHRTGYDTEAEFFSVRYYTSLKNLAAPRRDVVLPARRFL